MKTTINKSALAPALKELVGCGFTFRYTDKVSWAGKVSRHWLIYDNKKDKWIRLHLMKVVGKREVTTLTGRYKALGFPKVKDIGGTDAVFCATIYTML